MSKSLQATYDDFGEEVVKSIGSWRTREELIQDFKDLVGRHSDVASFQSIGKSFLGNDILLFRFGINPKAKILIDATIHGHEWPSSHTLYFLAQWLLETFQGRRLLKQLQVLLIPALNFDKAATGARKNANGVDLNRNFVRGWCGGSSDPSSNYYKGPSPASEAETKVLRTLLAREKPVVYVNIHDWGGSPTTFGDWRYPNYGGTAYSNECNELHNIYRTIAQSMGLTPHLKKLGGAYGGARDDGYAVAGAISTLWEQTSTWSDPSEIVTLELIKNVKMPHLKAFVMACAERYGAEVKGNALGLILLLGLLWLVGAR